MINVRQTDENFRVYLDESFGHSYGYIDLISNCVTLYKNENQTYALGLLHFVQRRIHEKADSISIRDWVIQQQDQVPGDGIEIMLDKYEIGESFSVLVGFKNNLEKQRSIIQEYLSAERHIELSNEQMKNLNYANLESFLESVTSKAKIYSDLKMTQEQEKWINSHISAHRMEEDTEKAIYRLSLIGVIDDYTVDYNKRLFNLTIKKRDDNEYIDFLTNYIRLYYSEKRAEQEMKRLKDYRGETTIQRCLGFLIEFIYREVAKKRRESIFYMGQACEEGLKPNGSAEFSEYLDLFFNSKYARREYLPSDTENGQNATLEIVWKYMELVRDGSERDNLKHLRGACIRLIPQSPDNPVFHILKAFAQLILEPKRLLEDSSTSLEKGFRTFKEQDNMSITSYVSSVELFRDKILLFVPKTEWFMELIDSLVDSLIVEHYYQSIKEFNNTFLRNYESLHS